MARKKQKLTRTTGPEFRDDYQAAQVKDYLHDMGDDESACLGDHHDWGKPLQFRGGKLPPGVRALPTGERDGSYQLRVPCRNHCGRVRTRTTLPGGVYDSTVKWEYEGGPKPPKGLGITRGEYAKESGRRLTEGFQAMLKAGAE